MDTTITTIEMCAGYGGIGLGLKNIFGERMRTLAYCELEGFAQANIVSKMEAGLMDVAPIWSDLKTFPYESFHGLVDILIAGYPCQPFSAAGKRAGKEDPRHLWPWIADGIRLLQPRMCFFENVEGHISLGLREVVGELEQMGYSVSWGIFSAREVGAPHQRKRVFILAHLKCAGLEGLYNWNSPSEQTEFVGADSGSGCQRSAWPSRPGEPQHGWEPPRVVAGRKIMDDTQERCLRIDGENQRAPDGDGNTPHITSHGGGAGEVVANSVIVGRGRGGHGDAGGLRGEIQTEGSCGSGGEKVLGNSTTGGLQRWGAASEMDRESTGAESEGRESAPSIAFASDAHGGEVLGNTTSKRSCGGGEDGNWEQPEMLGTGHEAVGNAESKQGTPRDHRGQQGASSQQEQVESGGGDCGTLRESNGQTEPPLGGDFDGTSDRMDYAELQVSCDNRTDELRLLGNGVVPATAERAFRTLLEELNT